MSIRNADTSDNLWAPAARSMQDALDPSFSFIVRLDKQYCDQLFVIDSVLSYLHSSANNEVVTWLKTNITDYQVSNGRRVLVTFRQESDMAWFRLIFACKPCHTMIYLHTEFLSLE